LRFVAARDGRICFLSIVSNVLGVGQNRAETFFEDLLGIQFFLAKGYRSVSAVLRGNGEATNTRKEI